MQKTNWQVAYENWMGERTENELSKRNALDAELDKQLQELLSEEAFNEVYSKTAALEAMHEEQGFKAGFKAGMIDCLEIIASVLDEEKDANSISVTHNELLELIMAVKEMGLRKVNLMIGSFFIDKVNTTE